MSSSLLYFASWLVLASLTVLHVVLSENHDIPTGAARARQAQARRTKDNDGVEEVGIYHSMEEDFEYDDNNKLAHHYIVFPAHRPECHTGKLHGTEPELGFKAIAIEGKALQRVFPEYHKKRMNNDKKKKSGKEEQEEEQEQQEQLGCVAAYLEIGTDMSVAGYTLPMFHFATAAPPSSKHDHKLFTTWLTQSCKRVEVCFINYVTKGRPLDVYWIEPSKIGLPRDDDLSKKQQNNKMTIQYGERNTNCFFSYVGHEFEAYIVSRTEEIDDEENYDVEGKTTPKVTEVVDFYEHFVVHFTTTKSFGISPPSNAQEFEDPEKIAHQVQETLRKEWSKHGMVERTFSSLGFAKGRLPHDVFASMGSFYYNNRKHVVNEEWSGKGLFVNWWETDVKFVAIPWELKQVWQLRLLTLVGHWSGVEVEETSMYGLREYKQGARLLSHVDRMPTHAVSLIVNIAQNNLAQPWPVEVFDHADRLHEVMMEPGDIVYYESAKNLHGRNRPLMCQPNTQSTCAFVNLFTHYRPKADGDKWYRNLDDLPNRPVPLLLGHVDSDHDSTLCTLPENDTENSDQGIGVGTVNCHNARLGSHLSPTLFKAQSGQHLFNWWKATADPNFIGWGHAKKMHGVDDDDDDNKDEFGDDINVGGNDDHDNNDASTGTVICQDKHQECTNWSNVGECETNPLYMLSTCCRSCHHRPAASQAGAEEVVATSTSTSSESGTPSITDTYTDIINSMDHNVVVDEDDEKLGDDYSNGDDYDYDYGSLGTPSTTDTTTTSVNDGGSDEL